MTAYYNEHDPFAAAWLRELIKAGHIALGIVDERSIEDVRPSDLAGFTQCHFFAGIGVWPYALRRAGWPDDKPVWTGSCPCQPFSAAGKGDGFADERHLWPAWFHLITTAKPETVPVFGEQVASKDGLAWLDLVQADLEAAGHAFGAVDLCAAGVGAPHIRQRLYFAAEGLADTLPAGRTGAGCGQITGGGEPGGMADSRGEQILQELDEPDKNETGRAADSNRRCGVAGGMADTEHNGCGEPETDLPQSSGDGQNEWLSDGGHSAPEGQPTTGPTNGLWRSADWLFCRDGKWRPVEPGTFPLVNGAAARVGRLRGYGNAINAEVATAFIGAYIDAPVIKV